MARILNNILCTAMIFLLAFAWAVFCLKDVRIAFLLASVVALCSCYVIFAILSKWEKKKTVKKKQKKLMQDFAVYLQFNADNAALFSRMFSYYGFETKKLNFETIIATKEEKTLVAFCFENASLEIKQVQKNVVEAKRQDCSKLMIFCNKANAQLVALANSQLPAEVVDLNNTFALLEQADMLPQIPSVSAPKQRILPQIAFCKKRFGWYFGGAAFTLFTSAFSFFKTYLLIWSTALFAIAMYCLFNKKYNGASTDVKLE